MASSWEHIGQIANFAQLTGLDAVRLIGMIATAANTARMHKKNCKKFAQHLKLIGNLLEQLKISELKKYPETREPLEQLEESLRRSYILVNSCQERSYLYLLAMGWNIVYQFKMAQEEIDRYLKIIPLITLVNNARIRERLEDIERDQLEYTLDEEDRRVQDFIMKQDSSKTAVLLKRTLSRSYPNMGFDEALKRENDKLQLELQRSQANRDLSQCEVIQHLIDVTEAAAVSTLPKKGSQKGVHGNSCADDEKDYTHFESSPREIVSLATSRHITSVSSEHNVPSSKDSSWHEEWHNDLLGCCSEPSLCVKTFLYPCGTFARIATVAKDRHISSGEACSDLMAYSLVLSCCCYTCCMRWKLRRAFNIKGGVIDDFLSHLMCCCCALVQEWREVEIRRVYVPEKTETRPPSSQFMEA